MAFRSVKWRWAAALAVLVAAVGVIRNSSIGDTGASFSESSATAAEAATRAPETAGCAHPYVPTRRGEVREYRWESTTGAGTLRMRLLGGRRHGDAHARRWSIEAEETFEIERLCDETGAEEPWLALGGAAGLELTGQSWRVPRDLALGDSYSGTFVASVLGFSTTITRSHHVVGRETLSLAGQEYDALRVEVEERTESSSEAVRSTQWLAEEVGLLQLWLGPEEYRTEFRLTSVRNEE